MSYMKFCLKCNKKTHHENDVYTNLTFVVCCECEYETIVQTKQQIKEENEYMRKVLDLD